MIPVLQRVIRHGPFRASNFGLAKQCRLRLLLDSEREYTPDLPNWPESILGIVIHDAIEEASLAGEPDVAERIQSALDDPKNFARSSAIPNELVPVSEIIPMSRLLRRIGIAQKTYSKFYRPESAARRSLRGLKRADRRKAMVAIERDYKSADGELVGRVDRWDRKPDGSVEITDFKSGKISTESGMIDEAYRLQLHAYALLLVENSISESIILSLEGLDSNWSEEFDQAARTTFRELLDELIDAIPQGVEIDAHGQSRLGEACLYCKHRPKCPAYRFDAPAYWSDGSRDYRMPNDVWGVVEDVQESTPGLLRIYLKDPVGRLVCVAHVPSRLLQDTPPPGSTVFFFNLRSNRTSGGKNWPTNFFIVDPARTERSAHAAKAFTMREGVESS